MPNQTKPKTETVKAEDRPFRVVHVKTGDVVKGFDSLESAGEDAVARNDVAKRWKMTARYEAMAKPE